MASSPSTAQGSRLLSRVLPVAIKFWLQTQLDQVGELSFDVQATDRQVLSGRIPGIALSAQRAVYQGVQITDVAVQATGIEINIGQVLRGKPLRLKQAFPIEGEVRFDGASLEASSTESILAAGLLDVWQRLLADAAVVAEIATHYGVTPSLGEDVQSGLGLAENELVLRLLGPEPPELCLRGQVAVERGHVLRLVAPRWQLPAESSATVDSEALAGFCWDLGDQVEVRSLTIANDQLIGQCRIMVQP